MPPENQSEADKQIVNRVQELFRFAFGKVQTPWKAAQRWSDAYENIIDYNDWHTLSEMLIPLAKTAVDQAMPFMMDYMFPKNAFLSLRPSTEALPFEQVDIMREYVEDLIRYRLKLKKTGYLTIKDSVKLGVGYGIVEPKNIRPERLLARYAELNGEIVASDQFVGLGNPEVVESYRYVPFFSVVPMPDGADPDECSGVFFLDFKYADEIEQMFAAEQALPEDRRTLRGDPSAIIQDTVDQEINGSLVPAFDIMSNMAGMENKFHNTIDSVNVIQGDDPHRNDVVIVPILKAYFRGEHIWLANGNTVIMHQTEKDVSLKNPLVMAQSSPDAGRWFTTGVIGASEDPDRSVNTFYNALMDILTEHLHPKRIVDKRALVDGVMPPHAPGEDLFVYGNPKDAVSYATPPPLNQGILQIGSELQQFAATAKGQPLALQGQAAPGLLRSGAGAFESLLSGSFGRQKLMAAMIQCGWLESLVNRLISLSQVVITNQGRRFISEHEGKDGNPIYMERKITPDMVRHTYDVRLDLDEKFKSGLADESIKLQKYQVIANDPYFDPYESRLWFMGNTDETKRLLGSRAKAEATRARIEQLAAQRLAEIQAQKIAEQQALEEQSGGQAALTRAEQALAGGASQSQGVQTNA